MKTVALNICKENESVLEEALAESEAGIDEFASRLINVGLEEMKSMRQDMHLFRGYLAANPRKNQPLWYFGFKLRKSFGWTHSRLLEVEDNILGSRIKDRDLFG